MAFDIQKTNIEITATDKTKVAFDSVRSNLTGMAGQLGALTGLLGAGAFVAFTKRIIDQADSMNDLSKRTGIAVEQIGAWRLVTEQSGTSMDALTQALGKGAKYLVQHGDDLQKIGINAKTSEELILQLSGVISKMPSDDPRRTALAMQVLGKSAGELIPLLSEGEQALRKQLETGREANQVTTKLAQNADTFKDNLAELSVNSGKLAVNFVGVLLPSLNQISQKMLEATKEGNILKGVLAGILEIGTQALFGNEETRGASKISAVGNRIKFDQQRYSALVSGGSTQKAAELLKDIENQKIGYRALILKQSEPYNKKSDDKTPLTAAQEAELKKQLENGNGKGSAGLLKTDTIGDRIQELARENALLAQGKTLEDSRTIARLKSQGASQAQIDLIMSLTNTQNQYEAAEKASQKTKEDLIKATEGHAEAMLKLSDASFDVVKNAQDEAAAQERNLQVLQLGESAVIRMDAARLNEAAASAEQGLQYAKLHGLSATNIAFVETEILRIRQLAAERLRLANGQEAQAAFEKDKQRIEDLTKAQDDAFKQTEQDVKRTADSIYNSITDSLVRSFEKGNGSFKSFLKGLQNTAKTAAIRLGIDFFANASGLTGLISQVARAISGAGAAGGLASLFSGGASAAGDAASGSGGGFGGLLSQGRILFEGITKGFGNLNNSFIEGIAGVGTSLRGFGFDKLGLLIENNSTILGNIAPFAGAAFSLLKGDLKGAVGQGIGAGIGLAIGGPVGGFIGSALGSVLGGAFGKKKPRAKIYSSQSISSFDGGELVSNANPAYATGKRYVPLGAESSLDALNEQFSKSLSAILGSYGLASKIDTYSLVSQRKKKASGIFNASVNGQSAYSYNQSAVAGDAKSAFASMMEAVLGQGVATSIQKSALPDGIKKFFDSLVKKDDVSDAINTLVGLKSALVDLPPVFNSIRNAIDTTGYKTSIADLKTRFAAVGTYTSLFYSEQEQFATFTKQLSSQLGVLDTPLLKSRDEYRKLVDGISVVDKSSSNLFNGLVALAPAMDSYFKQLESQKTTAEALANTLRGMNEFTSLAEYRTYSGVAENYSPQLANDFIGNSNSRDISSNSQGKATVDGVMADVAKLLTELRDLTKRTLQVGQDQQNNLQRIQQNTAPA